MIIFQYLIKLLNQSNSLYSYANQNWNNTLPTTPNSCIREIGIFLSYTQIEWSIICYFVMSNLIILFQDRINSQNNQKLAKLSIVFNPNKINNSITTIKLKESKN